MTTVSGPTPETSAAVVALITAAYHDDVGSVAQVVAELSTGPRETETAVLLGLAILTGRIGSFYEMARAGNDNFLDFDAVMAEAGLHAARGGE